MVKPRALQLLSLKTHGVKLNKLMMIKMNEYNKSIQSTASTSSLVLTMR